MADSHRYQVIETYSDGIKLLECPICGASLLYRADPLYRKRLDFGDLSAAHIYSSSDIGGLALEMEAETE